MKIIAKLSKLTLLFKLIFILQATTLPLAWLQQVPGSKRIFGFNMLSKHAIVIPNALTHTRTMKMTPLKKLRKCLHMIWGLCFKRWIRLHTSKSGMPEKQWLITKRSIGLKILGLTKICQIRRPNFCWHYQTLLKKPFQVRFYTIL